MNLIEYTSAWVKGEILQGKIMLVISVLICIATIAISKSDHASLKGMVIPLALIIAMLIGYGGFQTFARPNHLAKVTAIYNKSPEQALKQEYEKAIKDDKAYSTLKPIWIVLIIVSSVLYFIFSSLYLKGLSIGLIALFLTMLLLDSVLHYRLETYFDGLKTL